jgi:hypothetical protein
VSGLLVAGCAWLMWTDAPVYQFLVRLYVDKLFLKRTLREWGMLAPVIFIVAPGAAGRRVADPG